MDKVNPHPEILFYTRIRKSPYFYASRRHGVAMYSVINHQYHPRHYGDPVEEYWQLLNGVTLWDVGGERQVEITGPDAFEFTNMLTPRDLNMCAVGQCKYAFITTQDGGILNDPVLLRLARSDKSHDENLIVRFKEWHLYRIRVVRRRKSRGQFFCCCTTPTRELRNTAASDGSFVGLGQFPDCRLLWPLQRRQDSPLESRTNPGTISEKF